MEFLATEIRASIRLLMVSREKVEKWEIATKELRCVSNLQEFSE